MAFVVTKNVHVNHDDIAATFVEGAYHEDQAWLFNSIGEHYRDEPMRLASMAEQVAKHLDDSGQKLIKALAKAISETRA